MVQLPGREEEYGNEAEEGGKKRRGKMEDITERGDDRPLYILYELY